MDAGSFSPTSTGSVHSSTNKVAPGARDELSKGGSPRLFMPQWGIKHSPRSDSGHFGSHLSTGSPELMARSASHGAIAQTGGGEDAGVGGYPVRLVKGAHNRTQSSPKAPVQRHSPLPIPSTHPDSPTSDVPPTLGTPLQRPTEVTATGAPVFNKVDFSFGASQPLDLGIELDPVYSTYKASKSSPNLAKAVASPSVTATDSISSPAKPEDEPGTPYAAQVRVSVAQRVERAPSFRKGSLAELSIERPNSGPLFDGSRRTSSATTSSARSVPQSGTMQRNLSADLSVPRLRPPRASSPGGTTRPIGQGARSSYAGSTASSNGPAPVVFRRASSVYVPNNSSIGITVQNLPAPIGAGPGGQFITPGAKLPLNLLSLARRTAHISDAPGYAWRLNLLEKLEVIMGSFLTIQDAEAILSIGNGPEKRKNRSESRKSQIGMPTPSMDSLRDIETKKQKAPEPKTFFSRMKRVLSNPHAALPKETPPPLPTSRKAVFGAPLAQVAEYGFVTSMIAGQRHDLPGVTFATVEEIYRRGQGTKVPGLLQLQGEPGRVAKLVQIYDNPPDYGEHHDLSIESIHNVTSLLKRYLRDLPEPVLDQRLWRLFCVACVDSSNPLKSRIACAQIILRLLPTPNFSLLVYLVAFLSQVPLFPENKLSLEQVAGIFGSSVMSPRPAPQKKPAKGEMVITGPTDSMDSLGETIKKGQNALVWLLSNWSNVADGLLEPDFDIDESLYVDDESPAPTLNVEVPQAELHIQQPHQQRQQMPDVDFQPREAPAPPASLPAWSQQQHQQQPQHKAFSPLVEQSAEIKQSPQFEDVATVYRSGPNSPVAQSPSQRHAQEHSPRAKQHSASPPHQQDATQRVSQDVAHDRVTPKSPSLYDEEQGGGPPTPQKEHATPYFSSFAPPVPEVPRQGHAAPAQAIGESTSAQHHSPSSSTSEAPHMSSTRSSQSTEQSAEVRTPPSTAHVAHHDLRDDHEDGKVDESYAPVVPRRDTGVLDELLDYDDTSLYSFPTPPIAHSVPNRPSPFLAPSPFLTQEEIAAALASERACELASMPAPVNPAAYAERTGLPSTMVKAAPGLVNDKLVTPESRKSTQVAQEQQNEDEGVDARREEEGSPPPVPQKSAPNGSDRPSAQAQHTRTSSAPVNKVASPILADFEPKRATLPGQDAPGSAPATLLRSKDEQLREAQQLVEQQRKEVQSLWKQLTDLELERTAERSEMIDLRQEVESFKERMTKRLSRSLNEQERKKLEQAEQRAREADVKAAREADEYARTKRDLESLRQEAAHAKDEARRATDELHGVKDELARIEELRRKEQEDARSQIEALEAQIGSIRAVLLGGAGIKL
ncbi:hypothetical protein Rhopal_005198-T1 [Rhodotorula paludigena]|uniref:Rho-GAP domain-containing protein n=1 Tax=Rhodotorula paludigena TaxID=86838 RepID=A0AAV5GU90_9BASI|nr:hypothetical protein Rhopal_005198-T1 [Rhodotorula paludigena]